MTPPLVRTDFSNETKWEELLEDILTENEMGFRAYVDPISDHDFNGADWRQLAASFPDSIVVFVADLHALVEREVLCRDPEDPSNSFRASAEDLWIVENNLSTGNLLFEELLDQVGSDGILKAPDM